MSISSSKDQERLRFFDIISPTSHFGERVPRVLEWTKRRYRVLLQGPLVKDLIFFSSSFFLIQAVAITERQMKLSQMWCSAFKAALKNVSPGSKLSFVFSSVRGFVESRVRRAFFFLSLAAGCQTRARRRHHLGPLVRGRTRFSE